MASIQQTFSIGEQFRGKIVLLTGATGYVGGLVLECLLRTTGVDKVYVLLRPKNDSTAADRLGQYLQVSEATHDSHRVHVTVWITGQPANLQQS